MPLTGKSIAITGGAGFIGTTLAARLVDANEVIAIDNLHRDALSGTDLQAHPNFRFAEGDVLDRVLDVLAGAIERIGFVQADPIRAPARNRFA